MRRVDLAFMLREKHRILFTVLAVTIVLSGAIILTGTSFTIKNSIKHAYSKEYLETIIVTKQGQNTFTWQDMSEIGKIKGVQAYVSFTPAIAREGQKSVGVVFLYSPDPEALGPWLHFYYQGEFGEGNALLKKGTGPGLEKVYASEPEPSAVDLSAFAGKNFLVGYIYLNDKGGFSIQPAAGVFDLLRMINTADLQDLSDKRGEEYNVSGTFYFENSTLPYFENLEVVLVKKPEKSRIVAVKTSLDEIEGVLNALEGKGFKAISLKKQYDKILARFNEAAGLFDVLATASAALTFLVSFLLFYFSVRSESLSIGLFILSGWKKGRSYALFLVKSLLLIAVVAVLSVLLVFSLYQAFDLLASFFFGARIMISDLVRISVSLSALALLGAVLGSLSAVWRESRKSVYDLIR